MKNYTKSTEETLVTFHIGRGGRFNNGGHKVYCEQNSQINSYTDHLFVNYENSNVISKKIGDRENLRTLFEKAIDGDNDSLKRIEKITGIEFGKQIYTSGDGNEVGLDYDNDDTGVLDEDGQYDTTIVCRLAYCDIQELKMIYESSNYKSTDVEDYCKKALIEVGELEEEEKN